MKTLSAVLAWALSWILALSGHAATGSAETGDVVVDTREAPAVISPTATAITATAASLGGNVTSDGGAAITERGVVYAPTATNGDPLIGGPGVVKATTSGTTGAFSVPVTDLNPGTSYRFKAYATNSEGTSYSPVASFLTLSDDANLSGLVLHGFVLSPSFDAATTTYAGTVQRSDGTVRILPTSAQSGASLFARVNGGGWVPASSGSLSLPLALDLGENLVEVRVVAEDGVTEATYALEIFRNDPRPDAMVGRSLGAMAGSGVYSGPAAQQLRLISRRARPVTGYVAAANHGNRPDRIALKGGGGSRFFRLDYFGAAGRVTGLVLSGRYRTAESGPGEQAGWLRIGIVPNKRLLLVRKGRRTIIRRKSHTAAVYATSVLDPAVRDGVSVRVETR